MKSRQQLIRSSSFFVALLTYGHEGMQAHMKTVPAEKGNIEDTVWAISHLETADSCNGALVSSAGRCQAIQSGGLWADIRSKLIGGLRQYVSSVEAPVAEGGDRTVAHRDSLHGSREAR